MFFAVLVCGGSLIAALPGQVASDEDLAAYETAKGSVGRSALEHVELALWSEAHGLKAERIKHLALAVLIDPKSAVARGLMGLVSYHGRWQRPEAVAERVKSDEALNAKLADYNARRGQLRETADSHWNLALWCEQNGLDAEAKAHFTAVTRLDPAREAAWKRLGCKSYHGRWLTDAQVAREKDEAELQKQADRYWKPLLEKWQRMLSDKSQAKRAGAEAGLAAIRDPRAVPAVWAAFASGGAAGQKVAVQVLGQIDAVDASRALAWLSVFSDSAKVRRLATETLGRRDAREYAGLLIALLRDAIKYEVRPVNGPGTAGTIFIEGQRVNVERRYNAPHMPNIANQYRPGDLWTTDAYGLPVLLRYGPKPGDYFVMGPDGSSAYGGTGFGPQSLASQPTPAFLEQMVRTPGQAASLVAANVGKGVNPSGVSLAALWDRAMGGSAAINAFGMNRTVLIGQAILETQRAAANAQQQLMNDVAVLDRYNDEVKESNDRVLPVLQQATGQDLPADRTNWGRWLAGQFGYAQRPYDPPATVTQVVQVYQPLSPIAGFDTIDNGYSRYISCFAAATMVHTLSGLKPIEAIKVGDEVLTQDLRTGALGYQPVLVVHHNPPARTFRIALGGELVISSEFHRFWKGGHGWVMARDLKPGDTLRTLGGLVRIESVETGSVQPVFNLDVAEDADFFVGTSGALVHDNTLPDRRLAPFDAVKELSASTAPERRISPSSE
jgi:hypothetical protein